ncbi:OstA family protein [Magnetococcus marinus MC-1]|uniref:OstA family protein n=1 Tax=Magnetococcus marinus (strain ATCC BAA-1437 / JCM 17883 / MC-1) TaxID=156889 RepID=A0LCX9_MAGMM|nr:LptA/OstA family protein [Magnetococcus marinus]ABK45822.1 OstA family protein [Magnetococcus marinus MC-1]
MGSIVKQWMLATLVVLISAMMVVEGHAQQGALTITADALEMNDLKQIAVFKGNVQAEEGAMQLFSDRMVVTYRPSQAGGTKQDRIREIVANGNVVLRQGDHIGRADKAVYSVSSRALSLEGNNRTAVVQHNKDRLEGQKIVLQMDENRQIQNVKVEGGRKGRVSAVITPDGDIKPQQRP